MLKFLKRREKKTKMKLRVISFNTASPWGSEKEGTSSKERIEKFIRYMKEESADLIGTQELNYFWMEEINNNLSEYSSYGVTRGGDESKWTSEMNGVFFKKDRFKKLFEKTFWLSKTPNEESRFEENGEKAACYRICSYVILKDKSGALISFFNTHLDHVCEKAMIWGAELILSEIENIKSQFGDINIVLSGDFNQKDDSKTYEILTSRLNDSTDKSKLQATYQNWGKDYKTNNGWGADCSDNKPIDFIFTNGKPVSYRVLDKRDNGYISDHFGIMSEIEF
ncbi:MAG: hypothetical protein IJR70_00440 [Eubacterium sp.]|nr:hypothetical protein [Eubacterium sp.]